MLSARKKEVIKKRIEQADDEMLPVLSALADKTRLKIFRLILEGEELCVTEVAEVVGISVPAASQHFRVLEMTG
ncbi:MAG: ArsR family transcriptional regulator, partial [Nitrososphaera sp.]|nr:ArsR family transcriptional regulator [Nitrososphaera sp.]